MVTVQALPELKSKMGWAKVKEAVTQPSFTGTLSSADCRLKSFWNVTKSALFPELTPEIAHTNKGFKCTTKQTGKEDEKKRSTHSKDRRNIGFLIRGFPLAADQRSFLSIDGWMPRYMFDYQYPQRAVPCRSCLKKHEYMMDMYNIVTGKEVLMCAPCCISEFSPSSRLLLDCLVFLASEGLLGIFTHHSYEEAYENCELVFDVEPTAHLLRMIDVFRWFFTFYPFQASGDVIKVTVTPLYKPRVRMRLGDRFLIQLVAGSWAPEFHSGVSLFIRTITPKPPPPDVQLKKKPKKKKKKKGKKSKK